MGRLGGVDTVEDVVQEMALMQRLLPLRPTVEQYEAALVAVSRAENVLATRLEELVREQRPDAVPQQIFRALQEMREDVLRMQVHEQKRPWMMVIEAEERHQRYDQLLRRVRLGGDFSSEGLVNGSLKENGTSVLNGIESSSSGEFPDDFHANGPSRFYPTTAASNYGVAPVTTSANPFRDDHARPFAFRSNYRADPAAVAVQTDPTRPLMAGQSDIQPDPTRPLADVQPSSQPDFPPKPYVAVQPDIQPVAESAPSTFTTQAPKVLTRIDEDGQTLQCPPKLLAMIEAAADKGSESLSIIDTFVRENILLPDTISRLSNLRVLELPGNRIVKLPDSIGELSELTVLDVQSNQLTALPESLGRLTKLKKLNIEKNAIEEIPWTIGNCESLEELRADFNQLKALPEAVGYLGNLKILTVHLNCLKSLPTTMAYLTSLTELDVHFNQLESVPESLCFVTTLRKLDISSNFHALRFLPYKIGNLQQLVELDISYNSILELPDSFVLLTNLQKLRVEGNPWRVPPLHVIQKGKQAIFEYLQERIKQKQQEKLARKRRGLISKATHACCTYLGRLCESKVDDSGLNILA